MKDFKMSELVGVYDNVLSPEFCKRVIDYFEECDALGYTTQGSSGFSGNVNKNVKDSTDLQLLLHLYRSNLLQVKHKHEEYKDITLNLFNAFKFVPRNYALDLCAKMNNRVDDLYANHLFKITSIQIQRYKPEQVGYPGVHVENLGTNVTQRIFAPIIYLNDIDEGGETEILLANMKVQPRAGRMLVIPANIPFWHCGHPSPKKTKYIVTSWIELHSCEEEHERLLRENSKMAQRLSQPIYEINPNLLAY
jgi:hypothetical protein